MIHAKAWTGCCAVVALLAPLAVLFPRPVTPTDAAFCSISVSPFARWPGSTYVFGSFEDSVMRATAGRIGSSGLPGHMTSPPADGSVSGQHLRVAAAGGSDAFRVYQPQSSQPQRMVIVLWDYDAGCETTAYGGSMPMGIPGEEALVVGQLRDSEDWVDGLPTIDTFWGGALVYPTTALVTGRELAEWAAANWPPIPWEREGHLEAEEALELMRLLPEPCQELRDPVGFEAQLLLLTLAYQDDSRWPLPLVLEGLRERPNDLWRRATCLADPGTVR